VRGAPLDQAGLAFLDKHFWGKENRLADKTVQDSDLRAKRGEKQSK
jgi:hypothetical protein